MYAVAVIAFALVLVAALVGRSHRPEPPCTHAGEYPCPDCGECFHCHDECREDS
jgi:hypothetical protein